MLLQENNRNVAKRHKEEFLLWFEKKVLELKQNGDDRITDQLLILSRLPDARVYCHHGYILNGCRFRRMESESFMMTNVSGSVVLAGVISDPQSDGQKRKVRGKTKGFSIQKKRKESDNGKLKVIIPLDRTVAVGSGANNFVTEISVKVSQHAKHDVKKWKEVPDLSKDRIVAHILDAFQFPDIQHNRDTILRTAKNLYRYRRNRFHEHFKKFATKEESLQNMPLEVDESEWKFLVEYFNSDEFKKMSERNKINKAKQETNHICGRKSFQAVSFAADKVKEFVDQQVQEIEEGTDVDPIVNAAFVKIVGEKSGYCRGQGSGVNPSSKKSMNKIQEHLQAQQKEVEDECHKREKLECKLMEVQNQLEKERKNREVMDARLVREQKMLKEGIVALVSHIQSGQATLPAAIFNIITASSSSDDASPTTVMDNILDENA